MALKTYSFAFGLGDKVVDETRTTSQENCGFIYRVEVDSKGIFYAVQGASTRWLAKEGALTPQADYTKPVLTKMEEQEPA